MNLKFKINKQNLIRVDENKIAGFARNYIYITFDFDKHWIDLLKYALFVQPDGTRQVVELGYGKELSCQIPNEVLKNTFFKISVFAGDLLTTQQQMVLISPSGYVDEIDDMDEDEILKSKTNDFIPLNKHKDDEFFLERRDHYEMKEHPYV